MPLTDLQNRPKESVSIPLTDLQNRPKESVSIPLTDLLNEQSYFIYLSIFKYQHTFLFGDQSDRTPE